MSIIRTEQAHLVAHVAVDGVLTLTMTHQTSAGPATLAMSMERVGVDSLAECCREAARRLARGGRCVEIAS